MLKKARQPIETTTVNQLAERLHVSPSTIYRRYRMNPSQLPPAIRSSWTILFVGFDQWLLGQARLGRRRHNSPRVATTPNRRHNARVATTPNSPLRRVRRKR